MFLFYLRPLAFYNFVLWNFHIYNVIGNNFGLQLNDFEENVCKRGFCLWGDFEKFTRWLTLSILILFTLNVGEEDM